MLISDLARFIGKTSASVREIQVAPLHNRALQRLMNIDQSPSVEKFSTRVQLLPEAKADLMLWSELSPQSNGAPMIPAPASLVIESDASNMGGEPQMATARQAGCGQ